MSEVKLTNLLNLPNLEVMGYEASDDEAIWPWCSYLAPVSWLVYSDTMNGRSRLNFSEWNRPQLGVGEITGIIQEGEMPPAVHLPLRLSAQLTDAEK